MFISFPITDQSAIMIAAAKWISPNWWTARYFPGGEKVIKPDDAIYQLILRRYQLAAGECVFFDDRKVNVEGARRNGILGIVFENYEQAKQELSVLLG